MKPISPSHPLQRAWELWHAGRANEAHRHYLSAVMQTPEDAAAQQKLGYLAIEMDDPDTAVWALVKSATLDTNSAETQMLLGVAWRLKSELNRAVTAFEMALTLRPDWPDCINNLSVTLEELGRLDEAHAWISRGLALAPNDPDLRNQCGCLLCSLGRPDEGIAEFERALELEPDFEPARLNLADARRTRTP